MCGKTLTGPDRGEIPRYLALSDFGPFPFQGGKVVARFHVVSGDDIKLTDIKIACSSQLITAANSSPRHQCHNLEE